MADVAVYSCITQGFDLPLEPYHDGGVDYVLFTDRPGDPAPGWDVVPLPPSPDHPRLAAKRVKCLPPPELAGYAATVWADGSLLLRPGFAGAFVDALEEGPVSLVRHPDRGSVMAEADESTRHPKYDGQPVQPQAEAYLADGLPDGLWAGGAVGRLGRLPRVQDFNALWMAECLRWTLQDQLSLPYALWRAGIRPGEVAVNLWGNSLFERLPHPGDP